MQEELIITPQDVNRYPLLEMSSQTCCIPTNNETSERIVCMGALLEGMGDSAIGLAAIQIGWPERLFMLRRPGTGEITTYINPTIVESSKEKSYKNEACLSLPDFAVRIRRPKWITIRYFTTLGEIETETFYGIMSRAVCHELDHLDGILIHRYLDNEIIRLHNKNRHLLSAKSNTLARRRAKNKVARKSRRKNRP